MFKPICGADLLFSGDGCWGSKVSLLVYSGTGRFIHDQLSFITNWITAETADLNDQ